jgi:phage repressor protein C with HTH and peptisase S24 domain
LTDLIARHEAARSALRPRPSASLNIVREISLAGDPTSPFGDYAPIEVLPTGPAATDADPGARAMRLLPRTLIEQELRARPDDLRLMEVRGDSMAPLFQHGDYLLIDTRDRDPVQPGPFALRRGDGYVLKNVERLGPSGRLRLFASNPQYTAEEADPQDMAIVGRPVWYARRL